MPVRVQLHVSVKLDRNRFFYENLKSCVASTNKIIVLVYTAMPTPKKSVFKLFSDIDGKKI